MQLYTDLMATADVREQTPLDVIRDEIIEVFERILSEVRTRRDELLEQVSEMKREFRTKNISVTDNLKGLEEMRAHFEKIPAKQNLAMKKQQESLANIDSEIEKLKIGLNSKSKFKFKCSINQLIERVKHFGEIIDESCVMTKYQSKLTATQVDTESQHFKLGDSTKLHIDCDKQLLFVLSSIPIEVLDLSHEMRTNRCHSIKQNEFSIVVFNAKEFTFIVQFGENQKLANCIVTSKEFVYVGYGENEYSGIIIQYKSSDYSVVNTLNISPSGIFITSENQVYIISYSNKNYKFHIYDRALNLKEKRDLCYQWPGYGSIISAKWRQGLFYILFNKQLLVFTQEGKNIRSIIHEEGKSIP